MIAAMHLIQTAAAAARRRLHRSRGASRPRRGLVQLLTVAGLTIALLAGFSGLGAPSADASPLPLLPDCKAAPAPDVPGSGLIGVVDPSPLGVGQPGSVYAEVGYAGMIWNNYDLGCLGSINQGPAQLDTWLGNQVFNLAKLIVAGVCWLHYQLDGGTDSFFAPFDRSVRAAVTAMWNGVFTRWISLGLTATALLMLLYVGQGDLARIARLASTALLALAAAALAYVNPLASTQTIDGFVLTAASDIQQGFLAQTGLGDQDTLPTVLTDTVIYHSWLRGEFGSDTGDLPNRLGRQLLRAQTFTKAETAEAATAGDQNIQAKQQQFTDVATQLSTTPAYPWFQGVHGGRTGSGVLALLEAICIGVFQLVCQAMLVAGLVVIRMLIVLAPGLAVIGVSQPGLMTGLVRIGGAAVVNSLLLAAIAGAHSLMVITLFQPGSGIALPAAIFLSAIASVVAWLLARPVKRLMLVARAVGEQSGMPHERDRIGWRTRRALRRSRSTPARRAGGGPAGVGAEGDQWWHDLAERRRGGDGPDPGTDDGAGDDSGPDDPGGGSGGGGDPGGPRGPRPRGPASGRLGRDLGRRQRVRGSNSAPSGTGGASIDTIATRARRSTLPTPAGHRTRLKPTTPRATNDSDPNQPGDADATARTGDTTSPARAEPNLARSGQTDRSEPTSPSTRPVTRVVFRPATGSARPAPSAPPRVYDADRHSIQPQRTSDEQAPGTPGYRLIWDPESSHFRRDRHNGGPE
jgi:hypothetical protein